MRKLQKGAQGEGGRTGQTTRRCPYSHLRCILDKRLPPGHAGGRNRIHNHRPSNEPLTLVIMR